ncbi:MAG TPA: hypothetical protein VM577_15300 [Anaerovoracaceae bacterium]|nr:hypothetical protein [Anaerovoracaceae bacterium]
MLARHDINPTDPLAPIVALTGWCGKVGEQIPKVLEEVMSRCNGDLNLFAQSFIEIMVKYSNNLMSSLGTFQTNQAGQIAEMKEVAGRLQVTATTIQTMIDEGKAELSEYASTLAKPITQRVVEEFQKVFPAVADTLLKKLLFHKKDVIKLYVALACCGTGFAMIGIFLMGFVLGRLH